MIPTQPAPRRRAFAAIFVALALAGLTVLSVLDIQPPAPAPIDAPADRFSAGGGVVVNLEARGTGGPVIMFETSVGNARLVDVFGASAPHPVGTSFAVEVYRLLPNDTDFSVFLDQDRFTGLNSAFIDGSAAYHTPQDTPSRMDRGSLQAQGDNVLGLARRLSTMDLSEAREAAAYDATYFPVPGFLVGYPGWLVWPIAGLAIMLW